MALRRYSILPFKLSLIIGKSNERISNKQTFFAFYVENFHFCAKKLFFRTFLFKNGDESADTAVKSFHIMP
jgi:hypothetical protein